MKEDQQRQQELMFKLQIFEQQIRHLQEQYQAVEQAITQTASLMFGLDDLKGGKGKEIMASIGKGIFVKAKIESDDLIVDVGDKNFVKKDIDSTQKLIKGQIEKLEEIKKELEENMDKLNGELTDVFTEAQE